mmetsp:Transcript_18156/g.37915  ORF Transcript_18156/g.37915 Transcript_18156/m.37915 type:complete len:442 (-) Transcript_18156:570-1895(-)
MFLRQRQSLDNSLQLVHCLPIIGNHILILRELDTKLVILRLLSLGSILRGIGAQLGRFFIAADFGDEFGEFPLILVTILLSFQRRHVVWFLRVSGRDPHATSATAHAATSGAADAGRSGYGIESEASVAAATGRTGGFHVFERGPGGMTGSAAFPLGEVMAVSAAGYRRGGDGGHVVDRTGFRMIRSRRWRWVARMGSRTGGGTRSSRGGRSGPRRLFVGSHIHGGSQGRMIGDRDRQADVIAIFPATTTSTRRRIHRHFQNIYHLLPPLVIALLRQIQRRRPIFIPRQHTLRIGLQQHLDDAPLRLPPRRQVMKGQHPIRVHQPRGPRKGLQQLTNYPPRGTIPTRIMQRIHALIVSNPRRVGVGTKQIPNEGRWRIACTGRMEREESPHDVASGGAVGGAEDLAVVVAFFANDPRFGLDGVEDAGAGGGFPVGAAYGGV